MNRPKPPDTTADAPSGEKAVISFRLPMQLANWLRKQAADKGGSLNDTVVMALDDLRTWFSATKPVAEILEADRNAFGDSKREYVQRLLQYRYDELVKDPHSAGHKAGAPPAKK